MLLFLIVISLTGFVYIARKGRELRGFRPLPEIARAAVLESQDGKRYELSQNPFYAGLDPTSDIVLDRAQHPFEICIFYHRGRFAFQTPGSSNGIRVNGENLMAGYLSDGDELEVTGRIFVFRVIRNQV